jgi:hypothetical protein
MSHALCSFSRLFGGSTPPFIGRFLPRCDACPSRVVDKIRRNTAVIAWGVASFLAMVLCGWFGILLLRLTGLKGVPAELDIVLTGLQFGSGTKPLHDLISNVQKAKERKEDPPEKKAAQRQGHRSSGGQST